MNAEQTELLKSAQQCVDHWDNHGRFRDFENEGEPLEVRLARELLALSAAAKAVEGEAEPKKANRVIFAFIGEGEPIERLKAQGFKFHEVPLPDGRVLLVPEAAPASVQQIEAQTKQVRREIDPERIPTKEETTDCYCAELAANDDAICELCAKVLEKPDSEEKIVIGGRECEIDPHYRGGWYISSPGGQYALWPDGKWKRGIPPSGFPTREAADELAREWRANERHS